MSIQAIAAVLDLELNDVSAKMVLIGLANHTSTDGRCFPSVRLLMRYSGLSERSVRGTIKKLEDMGLVRVDREPGRTSTYWLNIDGASAAPPPANSAPTPANAAPITVIEPEINRQRPSSTDVEQDARLGMDEDWKPSDKTLARLADKFPTIDLDHQTALFVAHNRAHPKVIKDADAAFEKWVLNAGNMKVPPKARAVTASGPSDVGPEASLLRAERLAISAVLVRGDEQGIEDLVAAGLKWKEIDKDTDARRCFIQARELARPNSYHAEYVENAINNIGGEAWLSES